MQEFVSYNAQWRDCAKKTEPWIERMIVILRNLEELKSERDALKDKVKSLDQLAIERTQLINTNIKELLLEDKNLEANVLSNHQERRELRKSFMSRNSAPVPSRSTLENSDEPCERVQGASEKVDETVEESIEAQEAAPAKRGRGKKAVVPVVSIVDSEEEAVEKVKETKAKGKKRVAVAKKQVEVEKKSAVLEVAAPAEVMETIESPETVPAKKSRRKEATGKKDAIEEAVVRAETEVPEDEKEIKKGRSKRQSKKATNEEKKEEVVENNHPVEAEAPIAEIKEKKERGKKAKSPAKAEEINLLHEDIPEPEAEEKAVEVTAGPKPKTGLKSLTDTTLNGTNITTTISGSSTSGDNMAPIDDHVTAPYRNSQTVIKAFEKIRTMADRMNLGRTIVDRANALFKQVHNGQHLKGHSTDASAATCLHIACRQEKDPRTFKEICDVSNHGVKEIGNVFNLIREALKITLDPIKAEDFIPRFCCNIGLPNIIQMAASHIARKAVELDIVPGRCPISVAAVAIYMASHAMGKKLTKTKLCEVAGVVDATVRQSYALMYSRAEELLPEEFQFHLGLLPQPLKHQ